MTTKPLPSAATPGRLPRRRRRRITARRLGHTLLAALTILGAITVVLLVLGLLGVALVTRHLRLH